MANPITPIGFRRSDSIDLQELARSQDEERQIREDNRYFEETGINRPPPRINDPLVPSNPIHDIANDGDSYDEGNEYRRFSTGSYSEDSPTEIIDQPRNTINQRINQANQNFYIQRDLSDMHLINDPINRQPQSSKARNAYLEREKVKEDTETKKKADENKKKFNNPITGLDL